MRADYPTLLVGAFEAVRRWRRLIGDAAEFMGEYDGAFRDLAKR